MAAHPSTEEVSAALSWMDDVEIIGDGPDGPYYVLEDGTVVTIEMPED
jgi:lysophospholipid acyltransferase (LPLAT)-like uncharacterized protein